MISLHLLCGAWKHTGPYREAFETACDELMSGLVPLFMPTPNNRCQIGSGQDLMVPAPLPSDVPLRSLYLRAYEYIGALMGLSMRTSMSLKLSLPQLLWKALLSVTLTLEDLRQVDQTFWQLQTQLQDLLHQYQSGAVSEDLCNQRLAEIAGSELDMTCTMSNGDIKRLDEQNTAVTARNLQRYCELALEARLNEFSTQFHWLRSGVALTVPAPVFTLLTPSNMERAVCGTGPSVELMRQFIATFDYHVYRRDSQQIIWLWRYLLEDCTDEDRAAFLKFLWGRSRIDLAAVKHLNRPPVVAKYLTHGIAHPVDSVLPRSHTCAVSIDIPEYSSYEVLKRQLKVAMTMCGAIDGDNI